MLKATTTLCYFLLFQLIIVGCQLQGKEASKPDKKDVTQRDLYRAARSQSKILLVDGWNNRSFQDSLRQLIDDFHSDRWEIVIKDHREVTSEDIGSTPTLLIGAHRYNAWIAKILPDLPFEIDSEQITISDYSYPAQDHSLVLSYYPNPLNVRMPLGLFTSNNEHLLWEQVNDKLAIFLRGNWNYQVLHGNRRILLGNLSQLAETRWELDAKQEISLPTGTAHQWKTDHFIFNSFQENQNPETTRVFTEECNRVLKDISQFAGRQLQHPIQLYFYPSIEIKGLMTGATEQSHMLPERNEVHTVFDSYFADGYLGKENQLIIRQLLGGPKHQALETGLAVYFSSHWQKQGYQYWAKHLIAGGNPMTAGQLLNPEIYSSSSSLIREALSGSLVNHLITKWGREQFLNKYKTWDPDEKELSDLTQSWWSSIKFNSWVTKPEAKAVLPFLKGFNFTHEGYQIYNGYGSKMATSSLDRIKELRSNAVAIVPYSWMRNPTEPSRFRFSQRAGSENDESIVHTISNAKKRELFTMIKPHVWVSGSWPGEVRMSSESNWELFFENYYQWISHYALMAEIQKVDALCIGVEFSKATLSQEQHWRKLIQKIRQVYSGNLTYAANWGEEFESIEFWDQLDFIGLNCYYPLSSNHQASRKELQQGFDIVLDKVSKVKLKYQKPLLITEIGFRSVKSPWLQPHEEAGEKLYDEKDQAESYSVVFETIAKRPIIDGIFWWKWPTNLQDNREEDRRFVPNGKESEAVIEKWFQ